MHSYLIAICDHKETNMIVHVQCTLHTLAMHDNELAAWVHATQWALRIVCEWWLMMPDWWVVLSILRFLFSSHSCYIELWWAIVYCFMRKLTARRCTCARCVWRQLARQFYVLSVVNILRDFMNSIVIVAILFRMIFGDILSRCPCRQPATLYDFEKSFCIRCGPMFLTF